MEQSIAGRRGTLRDPRGRQLLVLVAVLAAVGMPFRAGRGFRGLVRFGFALAWTAFWAGGWFGAGR